MKQWLFVGLSVIAFCMSMMIGLGSAKAQKAPAATPAATPTPKPTVSDEDEVIKIETEAVNVLFTAQDKNHRLLTNLKLEAPRILENGQPQQVVSFSRQVDLPLSLAILIDT